MEHVAHTFADPQQYLAVLDWRWRFGNVREAAWTRLQACHGLWLSDLPRFAATRLGQEVQEPEPQEPGP